MHGRIVWKAAGITAALAVGGTLASPVAAHGPEHRTSDRGVSFRVDSGSDTVDKRIGDGRCADARGRCTLRAAVQEANATSKPVTITLHRSVDLRVVNAAGDEEAAATGDLDVTGDVTIKGSRAARVDARGIDRAFEVMPGGSLDLTAVKITGGVVTGGADAVVGSGGGIANHGELSLAYVTIEGNRAVGPMASGGGVLNTGSLTATHSTFSRNEATHAGGAIEASGGTTTVRYSSMRDNVTGPTPGNGGALHLTGDGHVEVRRSSVVRNTASAEGGGLWNSATGTMVVDGGSYVDNVAAGDAADNGGGALFNDGGAMHVDGAYLGKNDATGAAGSGGGVLNAGGTLVVTRSTIEKNTASRAGGGIEAVDGSTELSKVSLLGNTTGAAPGNGGGLHISGNGDASVTDSTVAWNVAASEGGGLWNNTGTMTVTRVLLKGNVAEGADADNGGGALFNNGGTMRLSESTIRSNRATGAAGSGGGILNGLGVLEVSATSILDNRATRAGGGIEAVEGTTDVRGVTFTGNRTGASPGNGGALHLTGPGTVTIADTHVSRNAAAAEGGGLWNSSNGTMTAESTTVRKNSAPVGPNVFNDGGTFVLNGEPVPNGHT